MGLQAKLIVVAVLAVLQALLLLAVGWIGYEKGGAAAKAAAQAEVNRATARAEEIADRFETKLTNIRIVNRTITNEVRHETEKQIYTDCKVPESGRALLGRAVGVANGWLPVGATPESLLSGQPDRSVPNSAPAGR